MNDEPSLAEQRGSSDESTVVGVDLGGTKVAAARVGRTGTVDDVVTLPSQAGEGRQAVISAVIRAASIASGGRRIDALGLGCAGILDRQTGTVVSSTDVFTEWVGTNLTEMLAHGLDTDRIVVDNDVNTHLAGEAWLGSAADVDNAFLLATGTGIGGAIMTARTMWRGAHGMAGEVGHLPVPGCEEFRCPCGAYGHLEALGAGPGLHRYYLTLGGEAPDARAVVAKAATGDAAALQAVVASAVVVGRGLAGIATVVDPQVLIVSGGLAGAGSIWWRPMVEEFKSTVVGPLRQMPIRRSSLGHVASILGSAHGAWQALEGVDSWIL